MPRRKPSSTSVRIACDLGHPVIVGMGRDARDLYGTAGDVDEKQDVVGDQSSGRADLGGEEIVRCHTVLMSFEKRRPGSAFAALRGRVDAMLSENIGDGAAADLMPQIGQCALDSRISPRSILKRHTQGEIDDRLHDARPTLPAPVAVVPFESHQVPIPSQERVRRDHGFKLV